jgi:hypothetical protein
MEVRSLMLDGLKQIVKSVPFWLFVIVYFVGLGLFNGISTWVENIIRPRGFSPVEAGTLGASMIVGGILGAVIIPLLSDKTHKRQRFMLLGVLLAYALNPMSPAYGSGLLPQLIGAQALTSALGVVIWRRQWRRLGWYPTYVPLVSVVPAAVLTYGGSWQVITSSALLGALIAPPLACALAKRVPGDMHPYIGNVLSMAISTLLIIPFIGLLIAG